MDVSLTQAADMDKTFSQEDCFVSSVETSCASKNGLTAIASFPSSCSLQLEIPGKPLHLARAAVQVLHDPLLQQRLVEQMCDFLMEDARLQQQRR